MSATADTGAEIAKLVRLLGLDGPESLAYLRKVPVGELRDYRLEVTDMLYDDDREQLNSAAEAARLLPAGRLARIGEGALGPLICAHLSGLLDPHRAAEISNHFSIGFLAQLAAEMDPRRAVDVVAETPPERVLEVALAMAERGEHVAMGRFVAHLDDDALGACVRQLSDEDLLRVAYVVEGERAHERIFDLAGPGRIREMLAHADANGLGEEARFLRYHLSAAQRKRLRAGAKA